MWGSPTRELHPDFFEHYCSRDGCGFLILNRTRELRKPVMPSAIDQSAVFRLSIDFYTQLTAAATVSPYQTKEFVPYYLSDYIVLDRQMERFRWDIFTFGVSTLKVVHKSSAYRRPDYNGLVGDNVRATEFIRRISIMNKLSNPTFVRLKSPIEIRCEGRPNQSVQSANSVQIKSV